MTEPLLRIRNNHSVACGDPPIVNSDDPDVYVGYFENPFGEQWIFTYDRTSHKAELRGGDIGWDDAVEVKDDGGAELTLGHDEQLWLYVCIEASGQIQR